ncbi:MAG: DNA methyltransferase, partial [Candidatus Micrarchaeota archaeon]
MGMTKTFAPQYERTEEGWVIFPRDVEYRKSLFPPEVMKHPAKFNLYLVESLVEYLTLPGQTVLDPFAGSGSIMVAALLGRKVKVIELEPHYAETLRESALSFEEGMIWVSEGDCRQLLPVPCDCVITSPPYSNISRTSPLPDLKGEILPYMSHPLNLGRLSDFYFVQA